MPAVVIEQEQAGGQVPDGVGAQQGDGVRDADNGLPERL
jgi:hypothetical protein